MMAQPLAMSPVMTFIHQEERTFYGWYRQNSLLRLEGGTEAEVTPDGIPGVIFKGEVKDVLQVVGEGQLKPGAELRRFDEEKSTGRVAVAIKITDPALDQYDIPRASSVRRPSTASISTMSASCAASCCAWRPGGTTCFRCIERIGGHLSLRQGYGVAAGAIVSHLITGLLLMTAAVAIHLASWTRARRRRAATS